MADAVNTHTLISKYNAIKKPNELLRGMARHPEVCCIILVFLATLIFKYGNSFKSKPLVLPPKQPQFMFPPSTLVMDSPRGSLIPLIHLLNQEEFVFVMYYAPWCSKSQAARAEFQLAANFFKGEVKFAAVNCWWPEGECRKRYKFLMFPIFMAYHTKLDGYRYYGLPRAEHMIRFIEEMIHPVTLVHSKTEVLEILAKHDTTVLGFFNMSSQENQGSYRQFYYASMRILETDPVQPPKFAVVTQSTVAAEFGLSEFEDIRILRITNNSLLFPLKNNITCFNLLKWVEGNKCAGMVKRLSPEGVKSLQLSREILKGPAFIMFHAENPLFQTESGLCVLKDAVFRYRKCMIGPLLQDVTSAWSRIMARNIKRHQTINQMCAHMRQSQYLTHRSLSCCISAVVQSLDVNSKICNICKQNKNRCDVLSDHLVLALEKNHPFPLSCSNFVLDYGLVEKFSVCCHLKNKTDLDRASLERNPLSHNWLDTLRSLDEDTYFFSHNYSASSLSRRSTDRYVRHHLENLPRRLCDRLWVERHQGLQSHTQGRSDFGSGTDLPQTTEQLAQIGCSSNKSLNFYAMDSRNHWMFADALGVNVSAISNGPSAVLFDKENEEHYIMKGSFTLSNTMSFILDFEHGKLKRHKQSHSFVQLNDKKPDQVWVRELDSNTFLEAVQRVDKDVVVLVYAHWCGFCQTLSHTFLALAQYFSPSDHISFVRINGATNDLSWEYTFDSFPTVIFFPARRKADSVVFPAEKEMTLVSLVQFVLRHATYDTRLHLAADVCSKSCLQQNLRHSMALQQVLRRRQSRLEMKMHQITERVAQHESDNANRVEKHEYDKLSLEYLTSRLKETQLKLEGLKQLIHYLQNQEEGLMSRKELVTLFSERNRSSGV